MKRWEEFLQEAEKKLGEKTVAKWLRPLKIVKFDAANLYLEADTIFQKKWFEEQIDVSNFLNENLRPIKIHLSLKESKNIFEIKSDTFDPSFNFDNFYVSKKNEITYNLLKTAFDKESFNPIFIYGPSSSGKTHLLTSLAKVLVQKNLFVSSNTFTNQVVHSMQYGNMVKFRSIYRELEVLIIDDIHLLRNRLATQEEFFHTFNALHIAKKQIILSSNVQPSELEGIEERLKSRFEWGITLPLYTSEIEPILDIKIKEYELKMTLDAKALILELFQDLKTITKALETLLLHSHIEKVEIIDKTYVMNNLKSLIFEAEKDKLTPEKIISSTASLFDISFDELVGKSQTKECTLPRQIAMYLCREKLKIPYMKIGEIFHRDHSTVMSNIEAIRKEIASRDEKISTYIRKIKF